MTVEKTSTHPAVADYLDALAFRKANSPAEIARRHGISAAYLYRLVSKHQQESGLEPTTTSRPASPLSETIGAHASPVVPESEPGQQEAAENAANQS